MAAGATACAPSLPAIRSPIPTASPSSPASTTTISPPTPTLARRRRSGCASRWRSARAGLKVWKRLGLRLRDTEGKLIPVDDPRLDPLWAAAGELELPVLIHVADPVAFFTPLDRFNERWEELHDHPDWHFYPTRPKATSAIPTSRRSTRSWSSSRVCSRRHPGTDFIGAHVGCYAENLGWVGRVMDRLPELLRRHQRAHRRAWPPAIHGARLLHRAPGPHPLRHRLPARPADLRHLLPLPGNRDEYFNYGREQPPGAGRWQIYGLDLPDEVLRKVYFGQCPAGDIRQAVEQRVAGVIPTGSEESRRSACGRWRTTSLPRAVRRDDTTCTRHADCRHAVTATESITEGTTFTMAKIAFIGAGSTVFARNLLHDLFTFPELHDSTIALMDIDPARLADTESVAQAVGAVGARQPDDRGDDRPACRARRRRLRHQHDPGRRLPALRP